MPTIRKDVTNAAVAGSTVDLGAFNRFGGRGGMVTVAATSNAIQTYLTLQVGSDIIVDRAVLPVDATTTVGPTRDTASYQAVGAPGDPILVTVYGTAGTEDAIVQVDITNL